MPKPGQEEKDPIRIIVEDTSLTEFTLRKLPTDKQVEDFEEAIGEEAKDGEIDDSLSQIYRDDKGSMVDVQRLNIKRSRGFIFWLIFLCLVGGLAYLGYHYRSEIISQTMDRDTLAFDIEGKEEVTSGEEFIYQLDLRNGSQQELTDVRVEAKFPENFILLDSNSSATGTNVWNFDHLGPNANQKITLKGKLVGQANSVNILLANTTYKVKGFSTEYRKESSLTTSIKDIGLSTTIDGVSSALLNEKNELLVHYTPTENYYLGSFRIKIDPLESLEFIDNSAELKDKGIAIVQPGEYEIAEVKPGENIFPIAFKFIKKTADRETLNINYIKPENSKDYAFQNKTIEIEVVKSDLNLIMILNGSKNDQGVDFGQTLHYSIAYANKGQTEMKNVILMAVLESDYLDFSSLSDANNGRLNDNTIAWTKEEVPSLSNLMQNAEGTIDFSIKIAEQGEIQYGKNYQVKSFAQYSIGDIASTAPLSTQTRSNEIVSKFNSNLKLETKVFYFNEDNIAVGSGPLPPKVGQTTSFKADWKISNTLHELSELKVSTILPANVTWVSGKNRAAVGTIDFDETSRQVTWTIGRLPLSATEMEAEFEVSITPTAEDENKIMVLITGSKAEAIDQETNVKIERTGEPKTTRLTDDDIANTDGIVVR